MPASISTDSGAEAAMSAISLSRSAAFWTGSCASASCTIVSTVLCLESWAPAGMEIRAGTANVNIIYNMVFLIFIVIRINYRYRDASS